jgi:acyl-CoA synthetase (AMP-forming)/AMP-acid ligase II/thioesterase domain-containing protein
VSVADKVDDLGASATLFDLLTAQAERGPSFVALAAPGRSPMTYGEWSSVGYSAMAALRSAGIDSADRIALVVPNGPEAAAATIVCSSFAALAPLDPGSPADELERAFRLLAITCVIVRAGEHQTARTLAARLDLAVMELGVENDASAGAFTLRAVRSKTHAVAGAGGPQAALLARTSGTVGLPKLVELSHANVLAAAHAVSNVLALASDDRSLNVRPMFHMHTIVNIVAASLSAGASIVCTGGFETETFWKAMREDRITWFSAPPAIHRALLVPAPGRRDIARAARLRFIRSSSAPLQRDVYNDVEDLFGAPVLEGYGMTEAPCIACNPLPPGVRKTGSVGLPQGCEVRIIDEAGHSLEAEHTGEVVIRGPNVMRGYVEASHNAEAFSDGWLRTGDLGRRDDDGYVYLVGRSKDLINRGGQKIFPLDIETVLREDRSIADAVVFGVPHPTLGEEVAAAVVLRIGAMRSEADVMRFAAERVSIAKAPKRILLVAEFPRTPTGKVQVRELRNSLEQKNDGPVGNGDALTLTEAQVLGFFREVLETPAVGTDDNFFLWGGDSLRATALLARIRSQCGEHVTLQWLFEAPTPKALAERIVTALPAAPARLVRVQEGSKAAPLFFLNGDLDGGGIYVRNLARVLDSDRTVYTLPPHASDGDPSRETIEMMAADYADLIEKTCPDRPFLLAGYCNGGVVAYEVARILRTRRLRFGPLVLIGSTAYNAPFTAIRSVVRGMATLARWPAETEHRWYQRLRGRAIAIAKLRGAAPSAYAAYAFEQVAALSRRLSGRTPASAGPPSTDSARYVWMRTILGKHFPGRYDGPVHHIWGDDDAPRFTGDPTMGWGRIVPDLTLHRVPGDHLTMVTREADRVARVIAPLFAAWD